MGPVLDVDGIVDPGGASRHSGKDGHRISGSGFAPQFSNLLSPFPDLWHVSSDAFLAYSEGWREDQRS